MSKEANGNGFKLIESGDSLSLGQMPDRSQSEAMVNTKSVRSYNNGQTPPKKNVVKRAFKGVGVGIIHIGDTIKDGFKTFDGEVKKVALKPANLFTDIYGTMDITKQNLKKMANDEDDDDDSDNEKHKVNLLGFE